MWNYVQQCVMLAILIVFLVIAVVGIEALVDVVCSDPNVISAIQDNHNDQEFGLRDCTEAMRVPVYVVWSLCVVVFVPIQVLWIRIFKAHLDDLAEKSEEI